MRRCSCHCLMIVAAVASMCLEQWAVAGQLPPTFVSVYRPAVERLRAAYTRVSVKGTLNVEIPAESKSSEQSFVFRAGGNQRRLDLTTTAQQGMGLEVGASEMSMATPIGSLNTYTRAGSQVFSDAQQRKYGSVVESIDRRALLNLPYSFDSSGTILDMLLRSNVKVLGVRWIRQQGEPLVEVSYQENARHAEQTGVWNSTLMLAPQDGWALRSFNRTLTANARPVTMRGELQYVSGPEELPSIQAIRIETTEGSRVMRRELISINELRFGEPGREWFDSFTF